MNHGTSLNIYKTGVIGFGSACFIYSLCNLPPQVLNREFLLLLAFSLSVAPRLSLKLPRSNFTVTFSDTLVFLAMLFYGGSVAVFLATLEMAAACFYLKKKGTNFNWLTILVNISIVFDFDGVDGTFLEIQSDNQRTAV